MSSFDTLKAGLLKLIITNATDRTEWKQKVEKLSTAWSKKNTSDAKEVAAELLEIASKNPKIRLLDSSKAELGEISSGKRVPTKMTGRAQSSTTKTSKSGQSPISRSGGNGHSKSPRSVKTDEDKHEPPMRVDGIKAKATERHSQHELISKLQAIQASISGTLSIIKKEESSQTGTKPKGQQNKDPKKGQNKPEAQPVNDDINSLVDNLTQQMAELGECYVKANKRCDECHVDNNHIKQKIGQLHILVESSSHDDRSADEMIEDISKTLKEKYVRADDVTDWLKEMFCSLTKDKYTQSQAKQKKPEGRSGGKMVQKKPEDQLAKDDVKHLIGDVHTQLETFFQSKMTRKDDVMASLESMYQELTRKGYAQSKSSKNQPSPDPLEEMLNTMPTQLREMFNRLDSVQRELTELYKTVTNKPYKEAQGEKPEEMLGIIKEIGKVFTSSKKSHTDYDDQHRKELDALNNRLDSVRQRQRELYETVTGKAYRKTSTTRNEKFDEFDILAEIEKAVASSKNTRSEDDDKHRKELQALNERLDSVRKELTELYENVTERLNEKPPKARNEKGKHHEEMLDMIAEIGKAVSSSEKTHSKDEDKHRKELQALNERLDSVRKELTELYENVTERLNEKPPKARNAKGKNHEEMLDMIAEIGKAVSSSKKTHSNDEDQHRKEFQALNDRLDLVQKGLTELYENVTERFNENPSKAQNAKGKRPEDMLDIIAEIGKAFTSLKNKRSEDEDQYGNEIQGLNERLDSVRRGLTDLYENVTEKLWKSSKARNAKGNSGDEMLDIIEEIRRAVTSSRKTRSDDVNKNRKDIEAQYKSQLDSVQKGLTQLYETVIAKQHKKATTGQEAKGKSVEEMLDIMAAIKKAVTSMQAKSAAMITELERLKKENEDIQRSLSAHISEARRLQQENDKLQNDHIKYKQVLNDLRNDNEELTLRLSQHVSAKLLTNNPDIADLSDSDRPTKVAEHFSELYDNAWTDAFDSLTKRKMEDNKVISVLLRCLTLSYSQCLHYSKLQELVMSGLLVLPGQTAEQMGQLKSELDGKEVQKLRKDVEKIKLDVVHHKMLTDLRKHTRRLAVDDIIKYGHSHVMKELSNEGIKEDKQLTRYIAECLQLCWLMCQQEPRIHIDVNISKNTGNFDKRLYREYTKKGKQIDFVVWPPLFIQEGGSLLGKGIANGK